MKTIETELFGQVVVPEDISQIMTFLGEQPQRDVTESIYMWRGQGNIDWAIHSAAYRRLAGSKSTALPNEQLMRNYERDLLSEARHQGYGFEGGAKAD